MMNKKTLMTFVLLNLIAALNVLTLAGPGEGAEKFPSKEIIIVVPYSAGSSTDLPARLLAEYLKKDLGVPVIVENRTEGQSVKGVTDVYRAKPDGYTLLLNLFPRNAQMEVSFKTPFKILEMTYLPAFVKSFQVITVRNDSPYKSVKELVEASKKKPLSCSVSGAGSNAHLLAEMLRRRTGLNNNPVPFKGTVPAMAALLGGNVDMTTVDDLQVVIHREKVRPLAIHATERHKKNFPALPTIRELGYDVPAVETLAGLAGPPGMSGEIQKILSDSITKAIKNPEFISGIEKTGTNPTVVSGPEFRATAEFYYKLAVEYKDILTETK